MFSLGFFDFRAMRLRETYARLLSWWRSIQWSAPTPRQPTPYRDTIQAYRQERRLVELHKLHPC